MGIEVSPIHTLRVRSTLKTKAIWFVLIVLAVGPLFPLSNFTGHPHWNHVRWIPFQNFRMSPHTLMDVIGNTLWFLVFGYLLHYQRYSDSRSRWTVVTITAIAGSVSLSAELFQVFCHNRLPSMTDVACNTLGAALGGYIAEKQPATTSITLWPTKWLTPVLAQPRFAKTSGPCRQDLPPE